MILIDANNLINRTFHVAKGQTLGDFEKRMKADPTSTPTHDELFELQGIFLHLSLNELLTMKQKYGAQYGDILMCYDSPNAWRRRVYSGYKSGRRKSVAQKTPFESFCYKLLPNLNNSLKMILDLTPWNYVADLKVGEYGVEADDIIAVACKHLPGRHLICSTDQDYIQLHSEYVRQYNPFHKKLLDQASKRAIQLWKDINLISGQGKDSVPGITEHCQLDERFIKWCKDKHDLDVDHSMLEKIENEHSDLMDQYEDEMFDEDTMLLESGKRKQRRNLIAYKKPRMGDSGALKFLADFDKNMKINPRYQKHYERNQVLLLFDFIPEDVENAIKDSFVFEKKFFNVIALQDQLLKFRLYTLYDQVGQF